MKLILKIIGLLICCHLNAQVRLLPAYPDNGQLAPGDLWQVQLDNLTGLSVELILITEISRAGQAVYRQESHPVLLPAGQVPFNPALLRVDRARFLDREVEQQFNRSGQFPAGNYQVCLLARSPRGSNEFGRDCRQLTLVQSDSLVSNARNGLRFSGRSAVEYFYSDQPFWGQETDHSKYVRFDLQPRVQWREIPLGLNIFYTLGDPARSMGPNAISLEFDAPRFREQLREKLQTGLAARAQRIQRDHALDFAREEQLGRQLATLSDTALGRFQTKVPDLKKRLEAYSEKELYHLEKQLHQQLQTRLSQVEDTLSGLSPSDSLAISDPQQTKELEKLQFRLAEIREKIRKLEQLKREIAVAEQGLQQYRVLDGRSEVLRGRYQQLKTQNDSLRQLLPQAVDYSDPVALKRSLRQSGFFKPAYSWLLVIEEFKMGTYRPHYSPLILSGTQANGVSIGLRPNKNWQFMASLGKVQSIFWNSTLPGNDESGLPTVAAGKVSWGKGNFRTYLLAVLPFQKTSDQAPEVINSPPENGLRLGTGLSFEWPDRGFSSQLDFACLTTPATQNSSEQTGAMYGTAFQFSSQWQLNEQLQFAGNWQSVGSGYEDIGSPFLLPGMEHIDLQLEQHVWEDQLSIGIFYLRDKNRPIGFSPFTFENDQYGLQLGWQAKRWPTFTTRLGRNLLSGDKTGNNTWLWNIVAGHQYRIGNLQLASHLSFQHTQQQLTQQLAPQFYTFMEARQQMVWSPGFSTSFAAYQNSGNQSAALQDLRGADLQLAFKKASWLIDLTGGFYRQGKQTAGHRLNINIHMPLAGPFHFYVQAGRQPSFVNPGTYYLVRSGISGQF